MSITGKFTDYVPPTALSDAQHLAEAQRGEALYREEFAPFCEAIGMTIGELQKLPPQMVLIIMLLKMFNLLSAKIIQLDARLATAEGRAESVQRPLQ